MDAKPFRPFQTFELNPFLYAEATDLAQIQKKYIQLSRQVHPDRVDQHNDEVQSKAEEHSSRLNYDFSLLRDPWKFLESFLSHALQNTACPVRNHHQSPPELANDYFEIQEEISEMPKGSEKAHKLLNDFYLKVMDQLKAKEKDVFNFCKRFPFDGFGQKVSPWKDSDLLALQDLLETWRYYKSFIRDLEAKLANLK